MPEKTGKYTVVVTSVSGNKTVFFGNPVDRYEDAVKLQQNALSQSVGWQKAAIFDSSLKEVKEKPKD